MRANRAFFAFAAAVLLGAAPVPTDAQDGSAHKAQMEELGAFVQPPTEDQLAAEALESQGALFPAIEPDRRAAQPTIDKDFIVLGYIQSEAPVFHYRWNALTHVASTFNSFDSSGVLNSSPFAGRSSYLKAGGAADAAGVKVLLTVLNSGFDVNVINTVMTSSSARNQLITDIVSTVTGDSYCAGVTFDFEPFSWTSAARDGMTTFFSDLRAALPSQYEISVYADPTPSATQWDIPAIEPNIDYLIYSAYDWATGNTPHAITDFDNTISHTRMLWYLDQGLPPEKLVYAISTYGRIWTGTTQYDVAGTQLSSMGFTDGLYDTTLNPNNGGPHTNNYVTGDEVGWYTWNSSGTDHTATWEDPRAIAYKVGNLLSTQDTTTAWRGRRLGGIGFWSLMWLAETSSYDMRTGGVVSRTRTYPHAYQIFQETLKTPGQQWFVIDGWEGLDFRWRDPNEAPDTAGDSDNDSAWAVVASPAGAGAPASTTNAAQVTFDFESASGNKLVFAHEVLASPLATGIRDIHAVAATLSQNMRVKAHLYTPSAYSGRQIRMLLIDADNEIEMSAPYTLNATGWREIVWDLTNPAEIQAFTTTEPGLSSGDGTLDTAGGGSRDLGFFGFVIEGGGAGAGTVILDELSYAYTVPAGSEYKINEFRYQPNNAEFVEIYGPAGSLPASMQLRLITGAGAITTVNIGGQTVPNDGGGFGYFVVGDPSVPNVDFTTGFSDAVDNMSNLAPAAIQLYNSATGAVHDSVVYKAFGGLSELIRTTTAGVANEGYPWLGEIATGTDSTGAAYTKGRYPDGLDTDVNNWDFSFMRATPGAPNGTAISFPTTFNFNSAPTQGFQTYQSLTVATPPTPSPDGGTALRVVDTTGGGVVGVLGDASLGADGNGYLVTGHLYIPTAAEPAQAIAVGICGTQGSTFFTASTSAPNSGYENGYWLIYENAAGVNLNNGRADHPAVFEFVLASHDNMDGNPVEFLGSITLAATGVTAGQWAPFALMIDPNTDFLVALVNGVAAYSGPIPAGGPISGAVQFGFRENHVGGPAANEGTWIDGLKIDFVDVTVPVELDVFGLE